MTPRYLKASTLPRGLPSTCQEALGHYRMQPACCGCTTEHPAGATSSYTAASSCCSCSCCCSASNAPGGTSMAARCKSIRITCGLRSAEHQHRQLKQPLRTAAAGGSPAIRHEQLQCSTRHLWRKWLWQLVQGHAVQQGEGEKVARGAADIAMTSQAGDAGTLQLQQPTVHLSLPHEGAGRQAASRVCR
jgi:hypothetical protein